MVAITTNLIQTILYLLSKENNNVVFDTSTFNFYELIGEGTKEASISSIGNSAVFTTWDFEPDRLLKLEDFQTKTGKYREFTGLLQDNHRQITGQSQEITGTATGLTQENKGVFTENSQGNYRTMTGKAQKTDRLTIGTEKYILNRISHLYTKETFIILQSIEKLVDKIIRNTSKKKTIERTIIDYKTVIEIAKTDDVDKLIKLQQIKGNLKARIERQNATKEYNQNQQKRNNPLRKLKVWFTAAAVVSGITYFLFSEIPFQKSAVQSEVSEVAQNTPPTTSNVAPAPQRRIYTKTEIIKLINTYSNSYVGNWRQGKIIESIGKKELTQWEIKQLIIKGINKQY